MIALNIQTCGKGHQWYAFRYHERDCPLCHPENHIGHLPVQDFITTDEERMLPHDLQKMIVTMRMNLAQHDRDLDALHEEWSKNLTEAQALTSKVLIDTQKKESRQLTESLIRIAKGLE
jgi:hypothetical protein